MGKTFSKEDKERMVRGLFNKAEDSGLMPDIGIGKSLMKYSGLDSASVLEEHSSQLLRRLGGRAPEFVAKLNEVFECVPDAAGLGALVISLVMDCLLHSSGACDLSATMVRGVFGEEKASGVRDCVEECMKRLSMHGNRPTKALEDIERLERQLSEQLTRLKNSMLYDDQMSSRSMKHWTNGAAFHVQMLIHAARLDMSHDVKDHVWSIRNVIARYQKDLANLMSEYKAYKRTTITLTEGERAQVQDVELYDSAFPMAYSYYETVCIVEDHELKKCAVYGDYCCEGLEDSYVNYMFHHWSQIDKLHKYFSDLKENVRELVLQHNDFNIEHMVY